MSAPLRPPAPRLPRRRVRVVAGARTSWGAEVRPSLSATSVLPPAEVLASLEERLENGAMNATLSAGDVDADWMSAWSTGDEAVGGSNPTPDQDIVDEIGRALGVEQSPDAPVFMSADILAARDRHYWHLEREAASRDDV